MNEEHIRALLNDFVSSKLSSEEDVSSIERNLDIALPEDYRRFLLERGGGE